jgi:transcriptional regulator with PAS, ATPase and Fis domain
MPSKKKNSFVNALKNFVSSNSKNDLKDMLVYSVKIFDNLNQPYFIFDEQGEIVYVNNALLKLLNLEDEPKNIFALTDKKNAEEFLKKTKEIFSFQKNLDDLIEFPFSKEGFSMMATVSYLVEENEKQYAVAGLITKMKKS